MNDDFRASRSTKTGSSQTNQTGSVRTPTSSKSSEPRKLLAAPKKFHWWLKNLNKREKFLALMAAIALLGGAGFAASRIWFTNNVSESPEVVANAPAEQPKPTTVPSRLTGVVVPVEQDAMPVTGVMIENSPDARPQSGLAGADMVFEAIAEGGITRFLALYHTSQPDYIGPVRSVRPYFLDFLGPYDAPIVHAGGSGEALAQIRNEGLKDIDHGANGGTFDRVSGRFAPHNLYTSRARLLEAHNKRGYTRSNFTGLTRKEKETPSPTPNARAIDINISSALYNSRFDYDATTNSYKRSMAGKPHVDERVGAQISSKVIIGLVMPHSYAGIYSVYGVNGGGTAYVFMDGLVHQGTWEKANRKAQLVFRDPAGAILPLNPGQTWVSIVASPDRVKFTP